MVRKLYEQGLDGAGKLRNRRADLPGERRKG
jgi:hypothetical protein